MLLDLFHRLRDNGIPVSISEYLMLLDGLSRHVAGFSTEQFYYFARLSLIKDERFFDRFDQIFGDFISGRTTLFDEVVGDIPADWLSDPALLDLSEEDLEKIEAMGGWDELMKQLAERLETQQQRHEGGSKWIGTGGTSPFGAQGYNPAGVRIGQANRRQGRAVKVWDKREYRNLDDSRELGTRNLKMALRKLRRFAREGAPELLDINSTIRATADNAGLLDLKMMAERRNTVKVLLLIDVGGSMDYHARLSEELFSAAKAEFKRLEFYYFHNFIYERLWQDNRRRHTETLPLYQLMHTYSPDYKVIVVGDATMSPYEISVPGGSVEHWNKEAGAVWMQRLTGKFPYLVWLNPEPAQYWRNTPSIQLVRQLVDDRMFPLTVDGIGLAIQALASRG